jgi:RNA polymerase sigma-70 factor, ECF subfamily
MTFPAIFSSRSPAAVAIGNPVEATGSTDDADTPIMIRLRANDEAALGELLDRYWKTLVKYSLGFVGDLDSAEDVVQEAFVRVWRSRGSWAPTGTVRAYLYRIVRNLALQEGEKRSVRRRYGQLRRAIHRPPNPAEELDRKLRQQLLADAIDALSPRRREIVILARFHSLSYAQIAEVMGISSQTVANQMSSALRELRKSLNGSNL